MQNKATDRKNAERKHYDVFISYRRNGGEYMAKLLYVMLTDKGYSVFYDRESIKTGRFDEIIRNAIVDCTDFILILSPHMFDDRVPEKDEVIKEVKMARAEGKNILPLQLEGFEFPSEDQFKMPEELKDFSLFNAPPVQIEHFNYRFLNSYMQANKSNLGEILDEVLKLADKQPETFRELSVDTRRKGIANILNTYMEKENTEMVLNMIQPYLSRNFNEKKDFRYTLYLSQHLEQLKQLPFDDVEKKYYRLEERLSFNKHYIKSDGIDEMWVAFNFEDADLDANLRRDNIFFSESLKLEPEDVESIKHMTQEQLVDMYDNIFRVQVAINGRKIHYDVLEVDNSGVYAKFRFGEKRDTLQFKISFNIPFDAGNNHILVAISEPTFSPEILVEFDSIFETEMIPFFDDVMSLRGSAGFDGEYEFNAPNTWVMPMSGAIIMVYPKKEK